MVASEQTWHGVVAESLHHIRKLCRPSIANPGCCEFGSEAALSCLKVAFHTEIFHPVCPLSCDTLFSLSGVDVDVPFCYEHSESLIRSLTICESLC